MSNSEKKGPVHPEQAKVYDELSHPAPKITLNEQLRQLLDAAKEEHMIVAGVVADPRSVEHMKLYSSIGEREAVDLFAAVVKTYNKGKVGKRK